MGHVGQHLRPTFYPGLYAMYSVMLAYCLNSIKDIYLCLTTSCLSTIHNGCISFIRCVTIGVIGKSSDSRAQRINCIDCINLFLMKSWVDHDIIGTPDALQTVYRENMAGKIFSEINNESL